VFCQEGYGAQYSFPFFGNTWGEIKDLAAWVSVRKESLPVFRMSPQVKMELFYLWSSYDLKIICMVEFGCIQIKE